MAWSDAARKAAAEARRTHHHSGVGKPHPRLDARAAKIAAGVAGRTAAKTINAAPSTQKGNKMLSLGQGVYASRNRIAKSLKQARGIYGRGPANNRKASAAAILMIRSKL